MSDFPALENFLSAYFHQDWRSEHDTADAVAAYFVDSEDDEQVAEVRADLARLSAQGLDEVALANRLRALGSEYDPSLDGQTWQGWLETLRERFA
ncbi:contact-dependent growth inhibition system immunity protein [Luteimonas lutimaris]|uniref:CdiI immunity protein domain-containing protein n=1 Tax=Luteimonas lutimaris TaxID=698645 RepID=A0ABP7M4P0_9GAMM|nr:contact-dependent growth inhibition system immunity protein [Luteimonas sp.]